MKKGKIIIISLLVVVILVIILFWFNGFIPKQIAKVYGTSYMRTHFPEMQLEYVNLEWSKYHENYIITFKDKDNQSYSCVISPKYFPVSFGQGIFAIEETYKENYLEW